MFSEVNITGDRKYLETLLRVSMFRNKEVLPKYSFQRTKIFEHDVTNNNDLIKIAGECCQRRGLQNISSGRLGWLQPKIFFNDPVIIRDYPSMHHKIRTSKSL